MIDVQAGEVYSILPEGETERRVADVERVTRHGTVLLVEPRTRQEFEFDLDEFESMRSDGRANRISVDRDGQIIPHREIDPLTILDPDDPNITPREKDKRLRKQAVLKKKQTLRFYTMRYDQWERPTKGRTGLTKFIASVHREAVVQGHTWMPSPSSLMRAVDECGTPNDRPLSVFLPNPPEKKREKRWPKEIVTAAALAIEAYWDDSKFTVGDALAQFSLEAEGFARARKVPLAGDDLVEEPVDDGTPIVDRVDDFFAIHRLEPEAEQPALKVGRKSPWPGVIPTVETVRLWLHANANWHTWASRYGIDNANRQFRGRGRSFDATRPLEYVLFDHTQLDVWSVVLDEDGYPLFVARAWLTFAIDLYSRMILGAVIGYEPPSIHSVTACLRQVVRKKEFLLREFGEFKGAADGWGRPSTIIVDNGKEFVSPSFQASCEATGIDVIWAPVKKPTFKPHVERAYGTFNTMLWHRLPGGLPLTPQQRQQLGLEPQAEAVYTRPLLEDALWNTIATRYHLEVQKGIDMAPALKWARGLSLRKRQTVNNVEDLDTIIGRSKMVQLSAEGVTIHGNHFHDQAKTTALMNKMARFGKERRQRRSVTSSRTVWVRATWDPGDVTRVHIWDPIDRTSITLPNWDRRFSAGLSWFAAAKIREWSAERNQAFHSDAERAAARVAHRMYLMDILPGAKSPQRQQTARLLEPRTELVPGDRVEMVSVSSRSDHDIPHDTGIMRANRAMTVPKGRTFGGKRGAAKAAATRSRNRKNAATPSSTAASRNEFKFRGTDRGRGCHSRSRNGPPLQERLGGKTMAKAKWQKPSAGQVTAAFELMRIKHPRLPEVYQALDDAREAGSLTPRSPKRYIEFFAPSHSGKSSAITSYIEDVVVDQAIERGLFPPDVDRADIAEKQRLVLHVTLSPNTSVRSMASDILRALGDPRPEGGSGPVLLRRVYEYLSGNYVDPSTGQRVPRLTELLILDEIQQLSSRTAKQPDGRMKRSFEATSTEVTDTLKTMLIRGLVPLVFVGITEAREHLAMDTQLTNREMGKIDYSPLKWSSAKDQEIFIEYCAEAAARLLEWKLLPKPTDLLKDEIPHMFWAASSGCIGLVSRILNQAVIEAHRRDGECVELQDLAMAMDNLGVRNHMCTYNPFREGVRPADLDDAA